MYRKYNNSFGESYYDHACSIDYEKDVLDIDIQENNLHWLTNAKRWWNDLFLLSYSDHRSRIYYRSHHAMRMERAKQFRRYRRSIHPFSKFRNFWECFILCTILVNTLVFHHSTSILYGDLTWKFYFIGVICEFLILCDLFINMITGYIVKKYKYINLDTRKSILHYCSTKLFVHYVSSLPLQSIMFLKYGKQISCAICKCNTFVFYLRLLSFLRLFRLYDASKYWDRERSSFRYMYFFKFLRIAVLGLITILMVMNLADTICLLLVMQYGDDSTSSYYLAVIKFKYGEKYPQPNAMLVVLEFARVIKSFLLFSFGLQPQIHYWDRMVSLCAYIIANIFYTWTFIECHLCLSRVKYPQEQVIINKDRITNFLRWRQMSDDFTLKVLEYCTFNMTKLTITEKQNGFYHSLPPSLKREITLSSYGKYISRIPYFSEWPVNVLEEIVMLLTEEVYLKDDIVVQSPISSRGLMIVDVGVLKVLANESNEIIYLIDGDYFGEISLITDEISTNATVVALTSCKILELDKTAYRRLMREYPTLFFKMKEEIINKYKKM